SYLSITSQSSSSLDSTFIIHFRGLFSSITPHVAAAVIPPSAMSTKTSSGVPSVPHVGVRRCDGQHKMVECRGVNGNWPPWLQSPNYWRERRSPETWAERLRSIRPYDVWERDFLHFLPTCRVGRAELDPLCQLAPVSQWLGPSP